MCWRGRRWFGRCLLGERWPGAAGSWVGPWSAGQPDLSLPWGTISSPLFNKYCFPPPLHFQALLTRIHSQILIFILLPLSPFYYLFPKLEKMSKTFTTSDALLLSPWPFLLVPLVPFFTYNPSTSFLFLLLLSCLSLAHFKIFLHLIDLVNGNWIANN